MASNRIGCEPVEVVIQYRGGSPVVAQLPVKDGYFCRDLDQTSKASIRVRMGGSFQDLCCNNLNGSLEGHQYELSFRRDGKEQWVGPITDIDFRSFGEAVISAEDLSAWWKWRNLSTHDYTGVNQVDAGLMLTQWHDDAIGKEPSPNFAVQQATVGAPVENIVLGEDYEDMYSNVDTLADSYLDWTAFGRIILVNSQEQSIGHLGTITDDDFCQPLNPKYRGAQKANRWIVVGSNGVVGIAEDEDDILANGLIERKVEDRDIRDQATANAAALTRLEESIDPWFIESGNTNPFKPSFGVPLCDLIPGMTALVQTRNSCGGRLSRVYRIQKVRVDIAGRVSIQFGPLGTAGLQNIVARTNRRRRGTSYTGTAQGSNPLEDVISAQLAGGFYNLSGYFQ